MNNNNNNNNSIKSNILMCNINSTSAYWKASTKTQKQCKYTKANTKQTKQGQYGRKSSIKSTRVKAIPPKTQWSWYFYVTNYCRICSKQVMVFLK